MHRAVSRTVLFASGLALAAGFFAGLGWTPRKMSSADPTLAGRPTTERTVNFAARVVWEPAEIAADAAAVPSGSGPVWELTPEAAAQFSTLCQVRLLAAESDLDLSHREWAQLAAIFAQAQAVRLAYEAEIAAVQMISPARYRVEIPAYANAGDELRRQFLADLRTSLGDAVAAEVMREIGRQVEENFAGFGVSAQTWEIAGQPALAGGGVTIHRTARYWNSVDGRERLSTRREVELLSPRDGGVRWDALQTLLDKAG